MAEIIEEQPQQIPYITKEIASAAEQVKIAADEFFNSTKPNEHVPYVKILHDAIVSALPAVYPVRVGAPTETYIQGLLEKRKQLEQVDESLEVQKNLVKPEDEDAATLAVNLYQRFTMGFMFTLMQFEEGLPSDQRW